MKKKQTKHFVPNKNRQGDGVPACDCFSTLTLPGLYAFDRAFGEVAKTRRQVNCGRCLITRAFRKLK